MEPAATYCFQIVAHTTLQTSQSFHFTKSGVSDGRIEGRNLPGIQYCRASCEVLPWHT